MLYFSRFVYVYLALLTFYGRLDSRVLSSCSILVSFACWSLVYGAVSWFSESGFRAIFMCRRCGEGELVSDLLLYRICIILRSKMELCISVCLVCVVHCDFPALRVCVEAVPHI
jgi:hypothetical protein